MDATPHAWLRPALRLERTLDRVAHFLRRKMGLHRRLRIDAYHGIGTPHLLSVRGRVLADRVLAASEAGHSPWRNFRSNLVRFLSREIPHARIAARSGDREVEVVADLEGYFEAHIPVPEGRPDAAEWRPVELRLVSPATRTPVTTRAKAYVPHARAPFGIISDIDDTLLHTGSLRAWELAQAILFRNAHTRRPLPGVAALLRGLHGKGTGPRRPLFCVSSSPWNIHDLLTEFFDLQGFPPPVLWLRDWGLSPDGFLPTSHGPHKLKALRHILDATAPLPYILLGDSAQEDPEIYREILEAYPTRVLAAYIRNVNRDLKRPEAIRKLAEEVLAKGGTLLLAKDSLAIAEHALSRGWLEPADLDAVRREMNEEGSLEGGQARGLAEAQLISNHPADAEAEAEAAGRPGDSKPEYPRDPPR
jgi:phosphatidate phosphatase APP1